ncbi:hypothetical protein B0A58_01920 [Flavobacterium branchiophilum NBRC 15030 = ATCC 35035]|uniref:Na+-driven multidrug efflux pump n=1 Tax=Flavobacterium branchiophilum TaxID=55197 RepID=A0A543G2R3_9FLAO|nr:oligosaccharide flippase family protein [Flavobacterium branchiophilum]OXA80850.1 hypothetical protein B0A58_01920 [Flavobacterium branchiophilum NBRC 15030 = ATCC 35035]TQM40383.1 Na+-driven multidrug efflux pump [Flavobacterium branchiophilum]GEM54464.1 hypothetical protein FB1_06850 [Flavobacterium branchiophilum NBRC 15030 = ATCC 35035]
MTQYFTLSSLKNNHIVLSGFYKSLSGLSLFVSMSLLLRYLDKENYGLWNLVFTMFQWVLLMDFGIQSALKTKIPHLILEGNTKLVQLYIKSTYKTSAYIALLLFLIFSFFVFTNHLGTIFNLNIYPENYLKKLFLLNFLFFCLNFIANIHKSLYVAFLKGKYAELSIFINQFGFMILLFFLHHFYKNISYSNKLIAITIINGGFCFIVNLFFTIRFFIIEKMNLFIKGDFPKKLFLESIKLGTKYMIIQLSMIFIFTIDSYIISYYFGPNHIAAYDFVTKYFQFPLMIIIAAFSPLWSMFTKNYLEKERKKLLKQFKLFNRLFVVMVLCIVVAGFLYPYILKLWTRNSLTTSSSLIIWVALLTALRIFFSFYSNFLNGIGKLNFYMILLIIGLFFKIPLTLVLINLKFGINSVVLSSVIISIIWAILIPKYCYNILDKI